MSFVLNGNEYLTVREAAAELEESYSYVLNQIHYHRKLNSEKIGTGRVITRSELDRFKKELAQSNSARIAA